LLVAWIRFDRLGEVLLGLPQISDREVCLAEEKVSIARASFQGCLPKLDSPLRIMGFEGFPTVGREALPRSFFTIERKPTWAGIALRYS
jgi:hypothetical protein